MALIELDRDAPPAFPAGRPPARNLRYVTVFLATLLVLALGGAAPTMPVQWRRTGLAALTGAATSYQLVGGVLYTLDGNANRRTTTAWSIDPVRKRWSVSTPLQLDDSGTVIHDDRTDLSLAGDLLIQHTTAGTTVIDPATGRIRWTSPLPLLTGDGPSGLVQDARFAAGTVYDQSSGAPGALYFSADGVPHTSPPERTVLRGLDLASGRELWRRTEPGAVYVMAAGDTTDTYTVIAAGRAIRLDGRTGAVLRTGPLRRTAGESYPDAIGDVILLSSGPDVQAISRRTFAPLWQHTAGVPTDQGSCLGLVCDLGPAAITVLDPVTGRARWTAPTSAMLIARTAGVLETRADNERPIAIRDTGTGRVRVDLHDWATVADSGPGDPMVLFRFVPGTTSAEAGALRPGAGRVQPLGRGPVRVSECSSDARYVACRVDGGVEVFAYRA